MTTPQPKSYINDLPEYKAGKSLSNLLKLSSNENMLGPGVDLKDLSDSLKNIYKYPNEASHPIIDLLATQRGLKSEQILLGNGSDQCFELISKAYLNEGDEVISSAHTFSMYRISSQAYGARYTEIQTNDYAYDLDVIAEAVSDKTKVIFIANPNNPTGLFIEHEQIKVFLNKLRSDVLVVLDEAYKEFADEALDANLPLLNKHNNLIITRTFSKLYGLAALRLGYAMANESIINTLKKVKGPFDVNALALEAGYAALNNEAFVETSIRINKEGQALYKEAAKKWPVRLIPSSANFVCVVLDNGSGMKLYDYCLTKGFIIRDLSSFGLTNAVRITIGTYGQNKQVIEALNEYFN